MIDPTDKREFAEIMEAVLLLYGKDSTPSLLRLYWNALTSYPIEQVRWAFDHWIKDPKQGTFMPKPADIIRTIQEATGTPESQWLSANEAWATALPAMDEAATVVWTPETAKAFEVARPLLEGGDKIGARMAFIPAYERLVDQAKRDNRAPTYEVSAGWDVNMRQIAVQTAVSAGLLPPPKDDPLMLAPPDETPKQRRTREAQEEVNREEMRKCLADLAQQLRSGGNTELERREEERKRIAAEHEARKAEMIKQLQEKQGERM